MLPEETWRIFLLPGRSCMAPRSLLSRLLPGEYVKSSMHCFPCFRRGSGSSFTSFAAGLLLLPHGGVWCSGGGGVLLVLSGEQFSSTCSSLSSPFPMSTTSAHCLLRRAR